MKRIKHPIDRRCEIYNRVDEVLPVLTGNLSDAVDLNLRGTIDDETIEFMLAEFERLARFYGLIVKLANGERS